MLQLKDLMTSSMMENAMNGGGSTGGGSSRVVSKKPNKIKISSAVRPKEYVEEKTEAVQEDVQPQGIVEMEPEVSGAGSDVMEMSTPPAPVECNNKGKWMIAVVSSPDHFKARKAIRSTWGAQARAMGITVKHFVGQIAPDNEERDSIEAHLAEEGGDAVRATHFTESYHNLTSKALFIFEYARSNCYNGVMKVDDDTFLNVGRLKWFLDNNGNIKDLYFGNMMYDAPVVKKP